MSRYTDNKGCLHIITHIYNGTQKANHKFVPNPYSLTLTNVPPTDYDDDNFQNAHLTVITTKGKQNNTTRCILACPHTAWIDNIDDVLLTLVKPVAGKGRGCHHASHAHPLTAPMIIIAKAVIIQTLVTRCDCVSSDANLTLTAFNSRISTPFSSTVPFSLLTDACSLRITMAFSVFVIDGFIQTSCSHFLY